MSSMSNMNANTPDTHGTVNRSRGLSLTDGRECAFCSMSNAWYASSRQCFSAFASACSGVVPSNISASCSSNWRTTSGGSSSLRISRVRQDSAAFLRRSDSALRRAAACSRRSLAWSFIGMLRRLAVHQQRVVGRADGAAEIGQARTAPARCRQVSGSLEEIKRTHVGAGAPVAAIRTSRRTTDWGIPSHRPRTASDECV